MLYSHRLFIVFQIFRGPIWGLVAKCNVYLTLSLHEILRADHKMIIPGTEFFRVTFQLIFVAHICCLVHDTHSQSTSVFLGILFPYLDLTSHVSVLDLKDVFLIPVLN